MIATDRATPEDRAWFAKHPQRRYRAQVGVGGTWLSRRCGQALYRTFAAGKVIISTDDRILGRHWREAARPSVPVAKHRNPDPRLTQHRQPKKDTSR